jgi:hypothetical protein
MTSDSQSGTKGERQLWETGRSVAHELETGMIGGALDLFTRIMRKHFAS